MRVLGKIAGRPARPVTKPLLAAILCTVLLSLAACSGEQGLPAVDSPAPTETSTAVTQRQTGASHPCCAPDVLAHGDTSPPDPCDASGRGNSSLHGSANRHAKSGAHDPSRAPRRYRLLPQPPRHCPLQLRRPRPSRAPRPVPRCYRLLPQLPRHCSLQLRRPRQRYHPRLPPPRFRRPRRRRPRRPPLCPPLTRP